MLFVWDCVSVPSAHPPFEKAQFDLGAEAEVVLDRGQFEQDPLCNLKTAKCSERVRLERSPLHDRTARRPFPGFTRSTLPPADSQRLVAPRSLSASAPLLAVVPAHSHAHHDWLARHPRQGPPAPPQGRQLVPSEQHHHFAPAEPRRRRQGVDRFESQVARLVQGFVRGHPQVSRGTCS